MLSSKYEKEKYATSNILTINKGNDKTKYNKAEPKFKRNNKLFLSITILLLFICIAVAIIFSKDDINYVNSVSLFAPFKSEGLNHTYGDILDKYIVNTNWNSYKKSNKIFVGISGLVKNTNNNILINLELEPINNSDIFYIVPTSIFVDDTFLDQTTSNNFLRDIFYYYNLNYDSIDDLILNNNKDRIDYSSILKSMTFLEDEGINHTYGDVLNEYIIDPIWVSHKDDNKYIVDISGIVKGTDINIFISMDINNIDNNSHYFATPKSIIIDSNDLCISDRLNFLNDAFHYYDSGYGSIIDLIYAYN